MMSVSDLLKIIGLDHLNPGRNSKEAVERHFRLYIGRNRKMSEDHMKMLVSLRDEWKEKFDPDYGPKDFEKDDEEEERFHASQQYGADRIAEMLYQDELDQDELPGLPRGRTRWMNHQEVAEVTPVLQPGRKGKATRRGRGGDLQGQACGARMRRMRMKRMKVATSMPDKMTVVPPGHT